ncbi:T9SS type A sorting domain-containing protein [Raineya sp.]|jgi:hypothetical protein
MKKLSLSSLAFLLCIIVKAQTHYYVSTTGNDSNNGLSWASAKLTINNAIATASNGDVINIDNGTYDGCTLNKSVSLIGQGIGVTIIQGTGTGYGINVTTSINNVTISNLTITNFQNGIYFSNTATNIQNLTFNSISVSGNASHGVFATFSHNFSNFVIQNSRFNNNVGTVTRGIFLFNNNISISNLTLSNSEFNNNGLVGFDIGICQSLSGSFVVSGCEFRNNGDSQLAIYEGYSSPASNVIEITNNIVELTGNARFGIELKNTTGNSSNTGGGRVVVSDNRIFQSSTGNGSRDVAGIAIICRREGVAAFPEPAGVFVANNTIENIQPGSGTCGTCGGNQGNGFGIVAGGNNHRILNNRITGCQIGIQLQGGNINAGTANSSPSITGHANTLYFDRDNSTTANGNIVRYNNVTSYTFKAMRLLQNSNFLPNNLNDYTGNWLGNVAFALTDIESYLVANPGVTAPNFPEFSATTNSNVAFNPWAAVDLDDVAGNASGQRGVQINSSKTYRATPTETSTAIGPIRQGILIANTAFKDVLDIRSGLPNYTIDADILVNKAIHLLGNGGVAPRPILIMQAPCESILIASAPNITIEHLHLQVNGAGGTSTNGRHGIFVANHATPGSYNNLEIFNNYIENINNVPNSVDAHAYGIRLSENNIIFFTPGNNFVNIQNNIITNDVANNSFFRVGIRIIGNYGTVSNNTITGGGWYGLQWADVRGNSNITNNTILSLNQAAIEMNIPVANTTHNIANNNLSVPAFVPDTVSFSVIEIKDNYNANSIVNINNNTISGHPNVGIWLGRSMNVNINNNTFTPRATSTTYNHIVVNTKNRTFAVASGPAMTVSNISILNNTFNHSSLLGGIALLFANHHSGANPAFNNITIGSAGQENRFHPNISRFIALDAFFGNTHSSTLALPLAPAFPNPYAGVWVSGIPATTMASVNVNFNAVHNLYDVGSGLQLPTAMSNPNLILLENRIQHTIDYAPLGFVTVKPNHVFVTQASFIAPAFTASPRIRRGTNVINADGFTLNVEQGTYFDDGSATDRPLTAYDTDFVPVGASPVISENWEMNGSGKTLNMLGDLTINNQVIFNDGYIQTNANTLNFTPVAIDPAANPLTVGEKNNSRILGRARTIRNVGVGAFDFLGLNLPAGADLGVLDLLRVSDVAGIQIVGTFTSIACTWYIEPSVANGRNGVEFRWLPAINNGKDVNQLQAWRNNGTVWEIRSPIFAAPTTTPLISSIPINITAFSPWTISDIVNPLPVEFLSIQARYNENRIPEVLWNTLGEINTDFYEVERSFDAREFTKVGQVSAKKKSENRYVFEDRGLSSKITGKIYYRIKQIDKDGKFAYSRIVSLSSEKSNLLAGIYPNPTRDILFVNSLQENLEVKIQDVHGRTLRVMELKFGENQIDFSLLPQGVYLVEVKGTSSRELYKIVRN